MRAYTSAARHGRQKRELVPIAQHKFEGLEGLVDGDHGPFREVLEPAAASAQRGERMRGRAGGGQLERELLGTGEVSVESEEAGANPDDGHTEE